MDRMKRPVFVGTVALDVLWADTARGASHVSLGWGGVTSNMACAAGTLGAEPLFVSVGYAGELRLAVAGHLIANGVTWVPLPVVGELPIFTANIGSDGDVFAEEFFGSTALALLTPDLLMPWSEFLVSGSVVVTCTDVGLETLRWLRELTRRSGTPFWLLSSDSTEVSKLSIDGVPADFAVMNYTELSMYGGPPQDTASILQTVGQLSSASGRCLVTLGQYGSLLVSPSQRLVHYQPAPTIAVGAVTVRAGDVLAGCLLAGWHAGTSWEAALLDATSRTASYLRSRDLSMVRPYALLLSALASTVEGHTVTDDELRFLETLS